MGKTRNSANLVSSNNIFVDIENDKVGIGTTIPGYDLDVSGSINLTGNLYQNGSQFAVSYSTSSGISSYSTSSGISSYSTSSGISSYSTSSGISTISQGLTGTPNINIGIITATSLFVTGQSRINRVAISTVGINTTLETGKTYIYFSGVTQLTLPASPTIGDTLKIVNRSGTSTALILRNGSNIMGISSDVQFDELDGSYIFTYADNYEGWTIN